MSVLRDELNDLRIAYEHEDRIMHREEQLFWRRGGICCPGCGIRGWHEREMRQARREDRIQQLITKLNGDAQQRKRKRLEAELRNIRRAISYTAYLMENSDAPERYFPIQTRRHELATDIERKLGYMPTHDSPTQVRDSGRSVSDAL